MEPKQQPPYPLRMPSELRSSLEELASAAGRSLNAEIVGRLMESIKDSVATPNPLGLGIVEALEDRLERRADIAHKRVLLIGLQSQVRDARHRVARQQQLLLRMKQRAEAMEESGDASTLRRFWSEIEAEEKWLAELQMEHGSLLAEAERIDRELAHTDIQEVQPPVPLSGG